MESERAATHDEIWDDSALVDSWNQALDEYKKYHSIHAKGGTVNDIPNVADEKTRPDTNAKPETDNASKPLAKQDEDEEEGEVDETVPMDESDETSRPTISDVQGSGIAKKVRGSGRGLQERESGDRQKLGVKQLPDLPPFFVSLAGLTEESEQADDMLAGAAGLGPQTLLGNVQDEGLKTLLMSWYYAGYYTGLYEGKQQGLQQAAQARKGS